MVATLQNPKQEPSGFIFPPGIRLARYNFLVLLKCQTLRALYPDDVNPQLARDLADLGGMASEW